MFAVVTLVVVDVVVVVKTGKLEPGFVAVVDIDVLAVEDDEVSFVENAIVNVTIVNLQANY